MFYINVKVIWTIGFFVLLIILHRLKLYCSIAVFRFLMLGIWEVILCWKEVCKATCIFRLSDLITLKFLVWLGLCWCIIEVYCWCWLLLSCCKLFSLNFLLSSINLWKFIDCLSAYFNKSLTFSSRSICW